MTGQTGVRMDTNQPPIHVTKADKAFRTHVLANERPIHKESMETLRTRFQLPSLRLIVNDALALQLALREPCDKGNVFTPPLSSVTSTGVILWEECRGTCSSF